MAVSDVMHYLFTILLIQATINLSFGSSSRGDVACIESEKEALLSFKRDLVDHYNRLSSWDVSHENNCCKWAGIVCNNLTGHVQELHLANNIYSEYDYVLDEYKGSLKGKLNPWLLSLKHLSYLDLSYNDFEGIQIPSFMGSLGSLTYLNLIGAGFTGIIPHQLGNLSNLSHLGLRQNILYADNLDWLSGLSSLQHLDLSAVNLSKASDHWWQVVTKLASLSELVLSDCQLSHIPKNSAFHFNLTSLSVLDLSWNRFDYTPLPNWLFNLKSLVYLSLASTGLEAPISCDTNNSTALRHLDLSWCNFSSAINIPSCLYDLAKLEYLDLRSSKVQGVISDAIENMTSIGYLDLSGNSLEGKVPTSLGNLCHLKYIDLGFNWYSGNIAANLFDSLSSGCLSSSLTSLDLSQNSFSGHLTDKLAEFDNLVFLRLRYNMLSGPLPESLGKLSALEMLDMSNNRLIGSLPESLGALSNLESLNINSNMFDGDVSEVHFANLTNLKELFASGNSLNLKVNPHWIPPFRLQSLYLKSWKLGPQFPMWLKTQHSLGWMDLSNTQIADTIPNWFWNFSLEISYLNFSHNHIYGTLPDMHLNGNYRMVYLGSNMFNGSLPRISSNVEELDLSDNSFSGDISQLLCHPLDTPNGKLRILHLGKNLLSGKIPDCWMYWPELQVINLGNNALTGEIPDSMGSLQLLGSLHLRNNSLFGGIPPSLQNCSQLIFLDLGLNEFRGGVPKWIGTNLSNLMVLGLRSNILNGHISFELCRLTRLQILDLADNNLSGTIPKCFDNFKAMAVKQESGEHIFYSRFFLQAFLENAFVMTKGREMQYDTILRLVTSLDLSTNNLTGEIPSQLTALKGLRSLNLSGNHLKGRIPNTIGNMVSLESLDLSANHLSGAIAATMSSLTFLNYLNLSYNNLSGKIPTGTQLQSFDASSFIDNELCGLPLPNKCEKDQKVPATHGGQKGDDGDEVSRWFHMGIATGFAVGFFGIIAPLLFSTIWRHAYYEFFGYQWYKVRYRYNCL